ncbi:MAG: hypothetical protein H7Y12_01150 [Sphingobacteriaceae bacterium]|nr:hypothetical protein [Cytophagaceae bacterium]
MLANDGMKDTVGKSNVNRQLLTGGAQTSFARFFQKADGNQTNATALAQFLNVVNQYDGAPAQFLKANEQIRNEFRASVLKLNALLVNTKGSEAATWQERVNRTANTINFLWNNSVDTMKPVEVDEVQ